MTLTADHGLYLATTAPAIIDVPELTYLTIDGEGSPDGEDFDLAMRALYQVTFGVRGEVEADDAGRRSEMPLEALWGAPAEPMRDGHTPSWRWTLMLPQATLPAHLIAERLVEAVDRVRELAPPLPVDEVYVSVLREGRCVQAMHLGPYDKATTTIARLLAHAEAHGYAPSGRHHEIYLSDPDQTAPQWLRTIVRLPIVPQL